MLVLQTEEDHPYFGIYIEELGAPNMRLFNRGIAAHQYWILYSARSESQIKNELANGHYKIVHQQPFTVSA
jgi:hypothetical protein